MASKPKLFGLTEISLKRLTEMDDIFNFIGQTVGGEIILHTLDTKNLNAAKLERTQEVAKIIQKWIYDIHLKHGFNHSSSINDLHWQSYIHFLHHRCDANYLWHDDLFMFLLWQGKDEYLTNHLTTDRKEELYYKMLNVHGKSEEEMKNLMSTINFVDFISQELEIKLVLRVHRLNPPS